jgi:hypothetical protein
MMQKDDITESSVESLWHPKEGSDIQRTWYGCLANYGSNWSITSQRDTGYLRQHKVALLTNYCMESVKEIAACQSYGHC